jgi:four helix bundle protein
LVIDDFAKDEMATTDRHLKMREQSDERKCSETRLLMAESFARTPLSRSFVRTIVLVLERNAMTEPTFDHERLGVYRFSIEYVASSFGIAKSLGGVNRQARDQWLRAAQSIPLNIAEGNGKQSLKDKNRFFEIARGSALECAAIHDILRVCDAIDDETNRNGKSTLKRIVSMLTRLIQRTEKVAEDRIEYEYEYRELSTSTTPINL